MLDLKNRLAYYGFGFFIGIVLVFFFLGGKKASCNWMPNDRMLTIIRSKHLIYSDDANQFLVNSAVDSTDVSEILTTGDIDFSKSKVKNDPCRKYLINGNNNQKNIVLIVDVCDSVATIRSIEIKQEKP
ncbi:MAG: hypothetical protein DSY82_07010 [Flavobacteriia bacterium]|nr:MAG: hypothetical protein DSY82_07010 [Flavobacteriia bacterium]